jgi:energy-converting hydrogenase Eha subunit B
MGIDQQKAIRTLRLSLTCIFLFLITWYYEVPESAWTLITIWFVMYEYNTVGGVFTKSMLRFTGTTLSAVYGIVIVYCCANNPLINIIALIPGLFVYAYFFMDGDKTYVGTIGAVTLTIVLLNYNDIDTAILRVFNIIIGITGSMLMIRFFYPQYARDLIIEMQATFIIQLSTLIKDYLNPAIPLANLKVEYMHYEHKTITDYSSFKRLINEAKIETRKAPFFIPHAQLAMEHFKQLLRLWSVFFFYLSTDEVRTDPWIKEQCYMLLLELQTIARRLLRQTEEEAPSTENTIKPTAKNEHVIKTHSNMQMKQSTETVLTNIFEKVTLLDEEIKSMVLIYDVYDINLEQDSLNG